MELWLFPFKDWMYSVWSVFLKWAVFHDDDFYTTYMYPPQALQKFNLAYSRFTEQICSQMP